jgi:hypothetical protein
MYKVYFTNLGWFSANEGREFKDALAIAKRAMFDCSISNPSGEIVATWTPWSGLKWLAKPYINAA